MNAQMSRDWAGVVFCHGCHLECMECEGVGNLVQCGIIIATLVMFLVLVIFFCHVLAKFLQPWP